MTGHGRKTALGLLKAQGVVLAIDDFGTGYFSSSRRRDGTGTQRLRSLIG